jgi:antitoxin (DNA-binding transcriptional repressor) of toxin-antitoxin stability system
MAVQTLTVTEAARNLSDMVNRVYYQGYSFVLTRGKVKVAQLSPVKTLPSAELARRWADRPRLAPGDAEAWEGELAVANADMMLPDGNEWAS